MLTAVAGIAGVIFLCWFIFTLAVNALPFFVGLSVGMLALNSGAGTAGAAALGVAAASLTLVAGRFFFVVSTPRAIRVFVAALFAVPAAIAGYHVTDGVLGLGEGADVWRQPLGIVGALTIAAAAWSRLITARKAS